MCKYWGVPANITQAALSRTVVGTPFAAASKGHVNSKTEWFGDVGNQHASTGNGFLDRYIASILIRVKNQVQNCILQ